jgi:hypothetical protein
MSGFKAVVSGLVGIAVVSMLIGCGGNKSLKKDYGKAGVTESNWPDIIKKEIRVTYANSINAVGFATSPDKEIALQDANTDAGQKLAENYKMKVESLRKKFNEKVNDQILKQSQDAVKILTNIEVPGGTIVEELTAEGKDGFSAWVFKTVSPDIIKKALDEQKNAETDFKAMQAYKELEEEVAKDKAAKEANQ